MVWWYSTGGLMRPQLTAPGSAPSPSGPVRGRRIKVPTQACRVLSATVTLGLAAA
jgi:hypothetical protein